VLENLLPGDRYGAARGLAIFHLLSGEIERAVDWTLKAVEQRDPGVMIAAGRPERGRRASECRRSCSASMKRMTTNTD
jgi:hypothetical protein